MSSQAYCAVYDFELMPYALGDVLTWNVQTAIRCEELGRERVDILICLDERYPAGIYQRGLVTAGNCGLFFNELFGAFATHPRLGSIQLYRRREALLAKLRTLAEGDPAVEETLRDYEHTLARRDDEEVLVAYFTKYIHSHAHINAFAQRHHRIPLLVASMGTQPDIHGLLDKALAGKRVVPIHMRMRRLDAGYGGERTYARDSDFLEWYEFLKTAAQKHPGVQFVALGRLQEKPLELLKLPNVTSLRLFGLGLGHELTLILLGDVFIGTSSGFAAMANFSAVPYFITHVTAASCNAYGIEQGAPRLPFANERQWLVYEPETRELLMQLLERGLAGAPPRRSGQGPERDPLIDVRSWEGERAAWLYPAASTHRFFKDEAYADKETAFLVWPRVRESRRAWRAGAERHAWDLLRRIEAHFPRMAGRFPELLQLKLELSVKRNDVRSLEQTKSGLAQIRRLERRSGPGTSARRLLARAFPLAIRIRNLWDRRHRLPRKLAQLARRLSSR